MNKYTRINRNTTANFNRSRSRFFHVSITVNPPSLTHPRGTINKPGKTYTKPVLMRLG